MLIQAWLNWHDKRTHQTSSMGEKASRATGNALLINDKKAYSGRAGFIIRQPIPHCFIHIDYVIERSVKNATQKKEANEINNFPNRFSPAEPPRLC